jgi:hypothetical protein
MNGFMRRSTLWIIDWRYDGHPRRLWKVLRDAADDPDAAAQVAQRMEAELRALYGPAATLDTARPATPEEDREYLRGETQPPALCPTFRTARLDERAAQAKAAAPAPRPTGEPSSPPSSPPPPSSPSVPASLPASPSPLAPPAPPAPQAD